MKANSHHTLRTKRLRVLVGLFCVILFLIFVVPTLARSVTALVVTPIVQTQSWLLESPHSIAVYWRDRQSLVQKIEELERIITEQTIVPEEFIALRSDNESLQALIQNASTEPLIVASVIARPPHTPYDSLVLNVGSADGVLEGAIIYIGNNIAVGFIQAVFERSSVATLYSTPGITSTAYIIGPNIFANGVGAGGGVIEVSVPQGIALAVGDSVVLPGLRSGVIGRVQNIISIPSEPQQFAYVSNPVSLQGIRLVRVGATTVVPPSYDEVRAIVESTRQSMAVIDLPEGVLLDQVSTSSEEIMTASSTTP